MAARSNRAADHDEIDDRQTEGLGEPLVDAALRRSGIDQRVRGVAFGRWLRGIDVRGDDDLETRTEPD